MTNKESLIYKLTRSGDLTQLFKEGVIDYKVLMYRDIFYDLNNEIKINKTKKFQAVHNVADKYGVSIRTVYRAENFFKK